MVFFCCLFVFFSIKNINQLKKLKAVFDDSGVNYTMSVWLPEICHVKIGSDAKNMWKPLYFRTVTHFLNQLLNLKEKKNDPQLQSLSKYHFISCRLFNQTTALFKRSGWLLAAR